MLDYVQAYRKPSQETGTETPPALVLKPLSSSQQKDKVIISLTQYSILLNAVIADCIDELKAKDQYAARLREELK